jgi:hypothetical protein
MNDLNQTQMYGILVGHLAMNAWCYTHTSHSFRTGPHLTMSFLCFFLEGGAFHDVFWYRARCVCFTICFTICFMI